MISLGIINFEDCHTKEGPGRLHKMGDCTALHSQQQCPGKVLKCRSRVT